ncbi:MAG: RNA polymerase sigma factor [Elusimicrobiota bacterium]|nr:RNA polymerase sigma factor [Elusimicrobiota bacterium]
MADRAALDRFVDEYADKAFSFAMGLCADVDRAQDLVQQAFVKVFDHADRLEADRLDQWFLTVMRRIHLDGVKLMDNRPKVTFDLPIGDGLTVADALPDEREEALITRLERVETRRLVRRGIARLTPEHRAVLLMIDLDGMGYEETAKALGVPLNTVRSRIVRARDALREVLLGLEATP